MAGAWEIPNDVNIELDVTRFDSNILELYHDQMHVIWEKIEDGYPVANEGWTFRTVFEKHKEVIIEMGKRGISHITPINSLDKVPLETISKIEKPEVEKENLSQDLFKDQAKNPPKKLSISESKPTKL